MALDLNDTLGHPKDPDTVSGMARGLMGSEILKVAGEIRALVAKGARVCNLTVGDFSPREFPIPTGLRDLIAEALRAGETNYPPADGMPELRQAVQRFYARGLGLQYPLESIVIASGARPIVYGTFRTVVDPGDVVVYPVPSWNNNYYVYMVGAKGAVVPTDPDRGFMPTVEQLRPQLAHARLLCLGSPLNPTGTMFAPEQLKAVCQAVVEENLERKHAGRPPVIVLYDQIYWVLTHGASKHVTPVGLVPEMAPYTVLVDGISKAFAATGVRVGWGVGPPSIISRMRDLIGHTGAWAPRAEQIASARFLDDVPAVDRYLAEMRRGVDARLEALHQGLMELRARGLPVSDIAPQGAIYLSVRFDLVGRKGIRNNEDIRKLLLERAGFGVVPFQAFGLQDETGWFRCSVGAVSEADIREVLPRVEAALRSVVDAAA
ncbi:MAG TPA: aminotransferase class I/II-fold pyridoxal phosphate-dependent enzyme [Myxococcaceae bacterium]|nr:aminotransferase class I/II-fold pyridoxal phosphate-dependent enzyme [Myxococcaceae bacterium]